MVEVGATVVPLPQWITICDQYARTMMAGFFGDVVGVRAAVVPLP